MPLQVWSRSVAESSAVECDLLIRARVVVTQDQGRQVLHDGGLAVRDGIILDVQPWDVLREQYDADQVMHFESGMLVPGLVNAHCHASMTLLRGIADDLPLMEWLNQTIWPLEAKLTPELVRLGTRLACAEMIRTGTTAFMDGYFHEQVVGECVSECGIRAALGEGFFGFPSPMYASAREYYDTVTRLNDRFAGDDLIRCTVTPHSAFMVEPEHLEASYEFARGLDLPWQIHLAENGQETASCIEKYGKRPVELLESLGLLADGVVLHHCVDVNVGEVESIAAGGARVSHNPVSNLKLASGISPVQNLLDAGVVVGLGTDGPASSNQLNMFRDMGIAALLGKVRVDDASAVSAQTALDMATRNSAECLGWEGLGVLESGACADLVVLETDSPNLMPFTNAVSHLAYAVTGHEVRMTMVGGKILYKDGDFKTIDIDALKREVARVEKDFLGIQN